MRILITGVNGRIGTYLTKILKKNNWVRGLDLKINNETNLFDDFIVSDLLNTELVNDSLYGIDVVVHLAALMSWQPKDNELLFKTNVYGTYNLVAQLNKHKIKKIILASSGEVYPETNPQYMPITEEHPTFPTSTYGITKLMSEKIVKNICIQNNIPYTILRFGHSQYAKELFDKHSFFSGPRFYINSKIKQLKTFPQSDVIANTLQKLQKKSTRIEKHYISLDPNGRAYRMNITDVRDICLGIKLAISTIKSENQIFNICANNSFNFDDAILFLSKYTKLDVIKIKLETKPYNYDTSNQKANKLLNYFPKYDIYQMIKEGSMNQ